MHSGRAEIRGICSGRGYQIFEIRSGQAFKGSVVGATAADPAFSGFSELEIPIIMHLLVTPRAFILNG